MRHSGRVLVLVLTMSLLPAASASAAFRYAAPGGTGADPCENPSDPCSIFTAADQEAPGTTAEPGDTVELTPGTYTEAAGDLGPDGFVQIAPGVHVGGELGKAKPLIKFSSGSAFYGAFLVGTDARLSDVAIRNEGSAGAAVTVNIGGTVERVYARSTASSFFTCQVLEGVLRESVCLNESPSSGTAIGASSLTFAGTHTVILRGVTAIATGPGSKGGDFAYFASAPATNVNVSAKSVLIKGEGTDVVVQGRALGSNPGDPGANTAVNFDHSDYAEVATSTSGTGTAFVTPAGAGDNITAEPLLEADHYHQLPSSPTVDKGDEDTFTGIFDVDTQWRQMGPAVDIGADELANESRTLIRCNPQVFTATAGAKASCTVTVEDAGTAFLSAPTGEVDFTSTSGLQVDAACRLGDWTEASASCSVSAIPVAGIFGPQTVIAHYIGEGNHRGSEGSATVTVNAPPDLDVSPPETRLMKHPPKRTKKRKAKFTFTADEPGARFECKLDKKPFRACTSPFTRKVKPGRHKFQVRAIDAQGKVEQAPAVFRWKVLPAS